LEWKYVKKIESINNVSIFEETYNFSLPNGYKNLLIELNGGRPSKKLFKCTNGTEHVIKSFLSFNPEDKESIFKVNEWVKDQLPSDYIVFANDPGGNFICFNRSNEIFYWQHEDTIFLKIANNIESFIESLY
jgi:outer membrane protein assembly factor BamB